MSAALAQCALLESYAAITSSAATTSPSGTAGLSTHATHAAHPLRSLRWRNISVTRWNRAISASSTGASTSGRSVGSSARNARTYPSPTSTVLHAVPSHAASARTAAGSTSRHHVQQPTTVSPQRLVEAMSIELVRSAHPHSDGRSASASSISSREISDPTAVSLSSRLRRP